MKKILGLCLGLLLATSGAHAAQTYHFDKQHTSILFKIDHAGFSKFVGEFLDYDGTITIDEKNPENSQINVTIRPQGISTDIPSFDEKLQGEEFFNTEKHPTATFKSTDIKLTGLNTGVVTGDFTMLGKTRPLTMDVTLNKMGYDKWSNKYKAGFTIEGEFKRSEWGLDAYLPAVGDNVILYIESEVDRPALPSEQPDVPK